MHDMDSDDEIGVPSDRWVADLVRRVRGLSSDAPVSPRTIRAWRYALRRAAAQRLRWLRHRERREVRPPPIAISSDASDDVREVLIELSTGFWAQAGIRFVLALPVFADVAMELTGGVLWPSRRHEAAPVRAYAVGKVGGQTWRPTWGSRGAVWASPHGSVRTRSPTLLGPSPAAVAAVNACTRRRVVDWIQLLDERSESMLAGVLSEMSEVGELAAFATPELELWQPEPGSPRGVWPDPPPSEDGMPLAAAVGPTVGSGRRV